MSASKFRNSRTIPLHAYNVTQPTKPEGHPIKDPGKGIRAITELSRPHPTSHSFHTTNLLNSARHQGDDKRSRTWANCERRQREQTVKILTFDNVHNLHTVFGQNKCVHYCMNHLWLSNWTSCDLVGIQNKHLWSHEADNGNSNHVSDKMTESCSYWGEGLEVCWVR